LSIVGAVVATGVLVVWPAAGPVSAGSVQRIAPTGPPAIKHYPLAVALTTSGVLYVLEFPDNVVDPQRVETYSLSGRPLRRWSVPTTNAQGMAVDAAGNAYVTSFASRDVLKFSPSGVLLARWGAPTEKTGVNDYPTSVAIDGAGRVLVVIGAGRIETYDSDGRFVSTLPGAPGASPITGIAVSASGILYVASGEGIASLDPSTGALRTIVAAERLRRVSPGWRVAAGPADSIYAIHARRIEKYSAAGEYLGSVGGHRRANWANAAVASDGSIFIPHPLRYPLRSVVLKHAPITVVDETRPSIVVNSIAAPPRNMPAARRVLARMRYTLSEPARFRVTLKRRTRTADGLRYIYVTTVDVGVRAAGTQRFVLGWRAFGYSRRQFGEKYQVTLVAQDYAGNESLPARATFLIPPP
jgi:hypothetical protein